jgi:hypothetical protein
VKPPSFTYNLPTGSRQSVAETILSSQEEIWTKQPTP